MKLERGSYGIMYPPLDRAALNMLVEFQKAETDYERVQQKHVSIEEELRVYRRLLQAERAYDQIIGVKS